MLRISPLSALALHGRYGAEKGAPGVVFSIVHPLSIVMVIARKGKAKATKDALASLKNVKVLWAGPDQYFVQAANHVESSLYLNVKERLSDVASVSDQSHGRTVLCVSGIKARALLAKGTPVDLHKDEFPVGKSALTQMAHIGVHLTRTGEDEFTLSVFRSFSESFWEWLVSQAGEFGYEVK
jgi:methylglutamate dehydrogenase subunit D